MNYIQKTLKCWKLKTFMKSFKVPLKIHFKQSSFNYKNKKAKWLFLTLLLLLTFICFTGVLLWKCLGTLDCFVATIYYYPL